MAMSAPVKVNRLCDLPRELRDHIFEQVFLAETEAPESSKDPDDRREERQGWGSVFYERSSLLTNLQGLLGCCRQLRQESLETINKFSESDASSVHYKLDLAVWGCSLQPTWLYLPVPPKYVRQVTVKFRMLDHSTSAQWGGPFKLDGERNYGILTQYLLQMLRRFLHHGPSFATNPPGRRNTRPLYPLHIDTLHVDFESMSQEDLMISVPSKFAALPNFGSPSLATTWFIDFHPPLGPGWQTPEKTAFKKLSQNLKKIARIGILHGSVDEVRVQYNQTVLSWPVADSRDKALAAKVLSPYGWGPILKITQKSVDAREIAYSEALDCRPPVSDEIAEIIRGLDDTFLTNYEEYGRGWTSPWALEEGESSSGSSVGRRKM
ncbi:MAG: hypothetical protein HETSPECPRED_002107 [Heterodermia speciosa]|uniref:F-box domain-containing protein n=1 Tax=Heterodermia speciosa TaxID=116794 RepID=A0A8H3J3B5_9LECA|nr:MAG: hypothetical protein HETSPECPRED_002107 [Heterodermia speciosa]